MSKTSDAVTSLLKNWNELQSQRPQEGDFSAFGYPLNYEAINELFSRWSSTVQLLDEKGHWQSSPEVAISDVPISSALNELTGLVTNAKSNGVGWMLGNRFIEIAHSVNQQISTLTRRQAALNKQVAKQIAERGTELLDKVTLAARAATQVTELKDESETNSRLIADAASSIDQANTLAETTNSRLAEVAAEVNANAKAVLDQHKLIDQIYTTIYEQKDQADQKESELLNRISATNEELKKTREAAKTARDEVAEALRQARNQGLAGSFQSRSNLLRTERRFWTFAFIVATIALIVTAVLLALDVTALTYESLVVNLLRRIGVAAPFVWIGWYSARQISRVSRVQEDYEYKAASALAFQAYKAEVQLGNDPDLQNRLLELAITTFGENPVRLYDRHDDEPVTPVQDAIKGLPPEKIALIMAAMGEHAVQRRRRLFNRDS